MAASSSSSPSMAGSLALAAATAMALSGSLVIYSLRRAARPPPSPAMATATEPALRPCLSSSSERRTRAVRPRRRVRFAEDVVDNEGSARAARTCRAAAQAAAVAAAERMPANREALYRGMLRDRSTHRVAYSC